MTEQTNVSPAILKMREARAAEEAAKQAQAGSVEGATQAPVEDTQQQQASDAPALDAAAIADAAADIQEQQQEQQQSEQQETAAADTGGVKEVDATTLDLGTPAPKQQEHTPINLAQVKAEVVAEQRAGVIAEALAEKVTPTNFFALRATALFKSYEKVANPNTAFVQVEFHNAHKFLAQFLFDSLRKAEGDQFIEMMNVIVERIRADRTAKAYYTSNRFFRGAEKQSAQYVALMNVLFDFSNKVNRQRLMGLNLKRIVGDAKIGEKLLDFINRV